MIFGEKFVRLHTHPAAPTMDVHQEIFEIHANKNSKVANGEHWHSDVSCDTEAPLGTMLQIRILLECGHDTNKTYPQANHPVVPLHPQTFRKALLINRTFIRKINDSLEG